jgi:hypothetical protein
MLCEIIGQAIAAEPDMVVVDHDDNGPADLGTASRRRRVDVIIFPAGANGLSNANICALLHANPRLGLVEMDGAHDRGTLHHLVPVRDDIGELAQSTLATAIRAGARLRRH